MTLQDYAVKKNEDKEFDAFVTQSPFCLISFQVINKDQCMHQQRIRNLDANNLKIVSTKCTVMCENKHLTCSAPDQGHYTTQKIIIM